MTNNKFDIDKKGDYIRPRVKYINNRTFNVESIGDIYNFEVDYLIAETISLLNKKGYSTKKSCSGHVLTYFFNSALYTEADLECQEDGSESMYLLYHGGYPIKYVLVKENSDDYLIYIKEHEEYLASKADFEKNEEYLRHGVFKVIWPSTSCRIYFDEGIDFSLLPNGFQKMMNNNMLVIHKTIFCDVEDEKVKRKSNKAIEQDIIDTNQVLLEWVKALPILKR